MSDAKIKEIIRQKQEAEKHRVTQPKGQEQQATTQTAVATEHSKQADVASSPVSEEKQKTQSPAAEADLAELKVQNQDLKDKLLRTLADVENMRKRNQEEVERASNYGFSKFAIDLTGVIENLFLAMDNVPEKAIKGNQELENFVYGIDLNKKELLKALESHGIFRIFPLGETFNHELHQAISKSPSDQQEDTVIQVVQAGYRLKDRLLKPALVVVATKQE